MLQYSATEPSGQRPDASTTLPGGIDCVYFLMSPGWKEELRSNRWHYATRWSRVAPVVLVQPDLPPSDSGEEGVSEPEPRISNCRILHIEAQSKRQETDEGYNDSSLMIMNQFVQIRGDMKTHGYHRPLLWLYNPSLVALYCALPATARIVHSTENYFEFSSIPDEWLEQLKLCLRISDLAVAVSTGVARSIAEHVAEAKIMVVSNGCDYRAYAAGKPDKELVASRHGYSRLAIYAGNINLRIDFDLLLRSAERFPETLFVLAGPAAGKGASNPLEPADQTLWERVLQLPNCCHLGAVDPDRLPDLYAAADIGIIPYKNLRVLRESGFALKALEMLASGLPVVSTMMRPLVGLTDGLVIVENASDFLGALERFGRGTLSSQTQAHMDSLCRANDYDRKFHEVLGKLEEVLEPGVPPTFHLDLFIAECRKHLARVDEGKVAEVQRLQALYCQEVQRLQTVYGEEVQRLQTVYGEEVQRLHRDYGDEVKQRNDEIERLHTVYLEAIQQRDIRIERLTAELQYFRRFRRAARRIPGAEALVRAVRFLRRPAG